MDGSQKEGKALPVSAIIVFLSLVGFMLYRQIPLEATRPTMQISAERPKGPDVEARLWQDPFTAVAQQRASEASRLAEWATLGLVVSNQHDQEALFADVSAHASNSTPITVLAVMLFGGPYAEEAETRRRWRYATVSALASSDYVPQDSQKIGYYEPSVTPCASFPPIVPYEWFIPKNDSTAERQTDGVRGPVLVLWLNDGRLGARVAGADSAASAPPVADWLRRAARSRTDSSSSCSDWQPIGRPFYSLFKLLGALKGGTANGKVQMHFRVIGPAGTTTLAAMVKEVQSTAAQGSEYDRALNEIAPLDIYSATATGDDCLILEQPLGCKKQASELIRDSALGATGRLRLVRTISTDTRHAQALAEELFLRGALAPGSHVVLVSEWDTDYGRALPRVMASAVERYPGVEVDEFSYLRGLDGLLPGESPPKTEQKQQAEAFEKERPTGRPRYDYLRRIVDSVQRRNIELAEKNERVQAVGVLGSDFYDKQLILQAMRPVLTNVFFFTTDLDARLLHPADVRWNRNLIIASSYGLNLASSLQRNIPPFRSGYQSSIYLAGLRALHLENAHDVGSEQKPRVFEVGRTAAFDLTRDSGQPATEAADEALEAALQKGIVYPEPFPFFPTAEIWWEIVLISIVGLVLIVYMSTSAKIAIQRAWKEHQCYWRAVVLSVIGSILVALGLFQALKDEPFLLFEGISAWPGTLLQILAIGLAVIFILVGRQKLASTENDLDKFVSQQGGTERSTEQRGWLNTVFCPVFSWRHQITAEQVSGEEVWQEYKQRADARRRLIRISVPFLAYIVIVIGLVLASDQNIPVRGHAGAWVVQAISLTGFALMSLLTFLVVDATHLCRRFIEILSERNVQWNEQTKKGFKKIKKEKASHDEWITLEVISEQANTVAQLIVYPFVVLLIVVVSRLSFFDNWNTPLAVALIYLTLATYAFISVFILHKAAEQARRFTIDALEDMMIGKYHEKDVADEFRVLIERIRSMRRGAFRPLAEQPVIKALLLPFGGGLGLIALDYLNWLG